MDSTKESYAKGDEKVGGMHDWLPFISPPFSSIMTVEIFRLLPISPFFELLPGNNASRLVFKLPNIHTLALFDQHDCTNFSLF